MRNIFFLLIFFCVGCISSPLTHSYFPLDIESHEFKLKQGDELKITFRTGKILELSVREATKTEIIGKSQRVAIKEIDKIEKYEQSGTKSAIWLATIVGLINFVANNVAFFP